MATLRMKNRGFTVIELMLAIAIIALLATLLSPVLGKARAKAESVACGANLKKIFVGISAAANDNENKYPYIEPKPKSDTLYPEPELEAKSLFETLEPYGLTQNDLRCPSDAKKGANSFFTLEGTSYEWRPYVDDELTTAPRIYGRRNGSAYTPKLSRLRLAFDFENVHRNGKNTLFADGHTSIR